MLGLIHSSNGTLINVLTRTRRYSIVVALQPGHFITVGKQQPVAAWLTATEIIDTLLSHACAEIGVVVPGNGSSVALDLELLSEELEYQAVKNPTAAIESKLAKVDELKRKAALWNRELSEAVAKAELGKAPEILVPKNHRTPLDHKEYNDWCFSASSAYRWAITYPRIRVDEWAGLEELPESSAIETPAAMTDIELAQRTLADLIRQFMIAFDPSWAPGQVPEERTSTKFIVNGRVKASVIANDLAAVNLNSTAGDDSRTAREHIADVKPLVEGTGKAKNRTNKVLPGYYRTIDWLAVALNRKLASGSNAERSSADNHSSPTQTLLSAARAYPLVSIAQLQSCLELAKKKRLK
jgi:hypothetical protein